MEEVGSQAVLLVRYALPSAVEIGGVPRWCAWPLRSLRSGDLLGALSSS
jgi:hypothetical protein